MPKSYVRVPSLTVLGSTDGSAWRYATPEENQDLYKQLLFDRATKTPRQEKFLSRVSSFKRKKQTDMMNKKIRIDCHPVIGDTPRRDVFVRKRRDFDAIDYARSTTGSPNDASFSMQLKSSLDIDSNDHDTSSDSIQCFLPTRVGDRDGASITSYGSVVNELKRYVSGERRAHLQAGTSNANARANPGSPSLYKAILLDQAMKRTPMKRVIVSKKHKRNSLVRRTVRSRRFRHSKSGRRGRSRKPFGYLGSPPTSSVSLPDRSLDDSPLLRTPVNVRSRISRSMDNFATRFGRTLTSPLRLIRTKNFDNIARWKDENQNDVSVRCSTSKLPDSMLSESVSPDTADLLEKPIEPSRSQTPLLPTNHGLFSEDGSTDTTDICATPDSVNSKSTESVGPVLRKKRFRKKMWKFW